METFVKIIQLNNAFEAERMREILEGNEIPFSIIPRPESALGGITRMEFGWGYLEAPEKYREQILEYYNELTK